MEHYTLRPYLLIIFLLAAGFMAHAQQKSVPGFSNFNIITQKSAETKAKNPTLTGKGANKVKKYTGECAPDTITLLNQNDIDSFKIKYPGCTTFKNILIQGLDANPAITNLDSLHLLEEVTEKFLVDNTKITTLAGLTNIKKVGIYFDVTNNPDLEETGITGLESLGVIFLSNLPKLTSMAGLTNNFTNHGTFTLIINGTLLNDLTGLEGIHSVPNMYISGNFELTSLKGLENLMESGAGISLTSNIKLTDISALAGITNLNFGPLELLYNYELKDLTGLHNIIFIKKNLWIQTNIALESLAPLNDNLVIENEDDSSLIIKDNYQLAFCSEPAICNYLSNGGRQEIIGNAPGCENIPQIEAACGAGCTGGAYIIFTGDVNNDWETEGNWNLNRVPESCDTVEIPSGKYVNLTDNVTVGTLLADGAEIEANEHNISIQNGATLLYTYIYNANTLLINCREETQITDCNIHGNVKLEKVLKGLLFSSNNVYSSNVQPGNLEVKDVPERTGSIMAEGNNIEGDFTLQVNTMDEFGDTKIAENDDMEVRGSVSIISRNRGGEFRVGKLFQGRLNIRKKLVLDAEVTDYPMLSKIRFFGNEPSEIIKAGIAALEFEEIYFEKDLKELHTTFNEDITITDRANFYIGLAKPTAGKKVIFGANAFVATSSSDSWVSGTIRKMGPSSFNFTVGSDTHQGLIGIYPVSATDDVAFEATYYPANPSGSGYDTAQRVEDLNKVSGKEYWLLKQVAGDAVGDKQVLLRYDSLYSEKTNLALDVRIAAWDGAEWQNKGVSELVGNNAEAYIKSVVFAGEDTIFTLGYIPTRLPVVTVGPIPTVPCKNQPFKVPIDLDTTMVGGNTFQVQLSNSDGNFNTYTIIGQKANVTDSDTIFATIPNGTIKGQNLFIRIVGLSPNLTSTNTPGITVGDVPLQGITIVGPDKVCLNSGPAKYYVQNAEPGASYNWSVTTGAGTVVPNNDTSFVTWTSPGPNRVVLVTSVNQCGTGQNAQKLNILVANPAPASTPVLTNSGRWITASLPAPPQAGIGIRWFRNGIEIPGAATYSYYAGVAGNYTAAYFTNCSDGTVSNAISFAGNATPQNILFEAIQDRPMGSLPFDLNASASSGLPVQFTIISGPGTIIGNTYNITGIGAVTIRATQQGNEVYDTAAPVTQSFNILKASQVIVFEPITDKGFDIGSFSISPIATSGLPCQVSVISGPATISGNLVTLTGAGMVTIRALQPGNTSFNAAVPVDRSFCVNPGNLNGINGPISTCPTKPVQYNTKAVPNAVYTWQIVGGATLPSITSQVTITWPNPGNYTLTVSVQGPCGEPTAKDTLQVLAITSLEPDSVSNMLPANGTSGLKLPLNLSWVPRHPGLQYFYDLYIWKANEVQPATPFASNISTVNYTLPVNSGLQSNQAYNWMVVAWNGSCTRVQTGPVQQFTLAPLADLQVTQVVAPVSAFSGQPISIEWTVKNNGPGKTELNESWTDAVFLSFDTIPFFNNIANNPAAWDQLVFPVRPLLIGNKPNVSALDAGASYTNSITFTTPPDYNWPVYAYVITNFVPGAAAPRESNYANDTARASNAINISLSPAPDLRVDSVITASPVFSGSTLSVRYKVKNYGANIGTTAPNTWYDKVYISKSPFFNTATAQLLKQPKPNGTYYSTIGSLAGGNATPANDYYQNNAPDASWQKTGPLENDSTYTRDVQVVLPNFISGEHYIFVVTDADKNIYEGPAEQNNTASYLTSVILTPTPQLIVSDLQVPFTTVSTTQNFGVNWSVTNTGSFDNLQRNAGHYLVLSNQVCQVTAGVTTGVLAKDSITFGNSYWIDRIYLSTDPGGLNISNSRLLHTFFNGSRHFYNLDLLSVFDPEIPGSFYNCINPGISPQQYNKNVGHVLNPGAVFPGQYSFPMPADLLPGTYYLYVATNADSAIYEFPYALRWRRSAPITISRPDLRVSAIELPVSANGGQTFNIHYSIENTGQGSVFSTARKDEIYVSNTAVFNASAKKIATLQHTDDIASGASVTKTFSYTFDAETAGTRYFFVRTNADSMAIKETNYDNNISSASLSYSPGVASDLIVSNVEIADTVFAVYGFPVKYTVANMGSGTTYGTWLDSVFISCQPTFNRASSFFAGVRSQTRQIPNGGSYSDSFQMVVPFTYLKNNCFAGINVADAYFHVFTNSDSGTYETNFVNNIAATSIRKITNPNVDHIITSVTMPEEVLSGRPFSGAWNVKNIGYNPGNTSYYVWNDQWYFQTDSTAASIPVEATGFYQNNVLARNQSFTYQRQVTVPNLPTGDYYVKVITNIPNQIAAEKDLTNNSQFVRGTDGRAKKIKVVAPVPADLTGSLGTYTASIVAGQSFNLPFTITNIGPGTASPGNYGNYLWMGSTFNPYGSGNVFLGSSNEIGVLNSGASFTGSLPVRIPINTVPGNYILIFGINISRTVFENQLDNNLVYGYITVTAPPLTDFVVENIKTTDTALLGYPLPVKWQILNQSSNNATGFGTDGIYLSKNTSADSAVLQGTLFHPFNINALAVDSFTHSPIIQGVTEGEYNLLVKTDILNNFNDPNRTNNTGIRSPKLYVDVKAIQLSVTEANNLKERALYYKLVVPDSLEGATLLLTLKTPDSLGAVNQVFAGHQYIPSAARFDYAYETPNAGNQSMMMPSVKAGSYYIVVQTSTPNRPVQAIKLKVEVLPFAIVRVDANSGGNTGNVTIRLTGSLYTPDMVAKLKGPATITASRIYFTNSNQVFATFNLLGAPLGLYDVELFKSANSTTALLEDGFTVENTNNGGLITGPGSNTGQSGNGNDPGCSPGAQSGLNAQLVVKVTIPPKVFGGWPFVIQINYTNPTNVDIPIQTRVVFNEEGMPVALNSGALDGGATSSLYVELSETNGPPGFIRAGGSGTINVYSKAPADYPGHSILHYILR